MHPRRCYRSTITPGITSMLLPFHNYPEIEGQQLMVPDEDYWPGPVRIWHCCQPRDARAVVFRREKNRAYAAQKRTGGGGVMWLE